MSITQERRLGHKPWAESQRDAWPWRVPASKPIDDEQHGRRRHVAVFGQHLERHGRQALCFFDGTHDAWSPTVYRPRSHFIQSQALPIEPGRQPWAQV
jgi:hypothetical protein